MSVPARVDDLVSEAVSQILAEASSIRSAGRFQPDREAELDRCFAELAADPPALQRAVDAGALSERQAYRFATGSGAAAAGGSLERGLPVRALRAASHRAASSARRLAGPRLRSLERQSVERAGALVESVATRRQVVTDHARRLAGPGSGARLLDRLSPGSRTLPGGREAGRSASLALGAFDPAGAASELSDWAVRRLERAGGPRVLHVRSGEGGLVARLAALGFEASGADPEAVPSSAVRRAGPLERLSRERHSLDGLVLSGATDHLTPATARALAQLAARALRRDGVVVLVSARPPAGEDDDLISSDLVRSRPLHPVTWCHLLARHGLREITVFDPSPQAGLGVATLYGVSARHP